MNNILGEALGTGQRHTTDLPPSHRTRVQIQCFGTGNHMDIRPTLQKNLILGFDTSTEYSDQARALDGTLNVLYSEE